jgi:hypothetical protein
MQLLSYNCNVVVFVTCSCCHITVMLLCFTTTLQLYDNSCRSQTQQHYSYMTTAADHKHNNITVIWQQLYRWREPEYKEIKKTYTWWMRDYMKMLLNFFCMLRAIQLAKKCLIIYHTSYYIQNKEWTQYFAWNNHLWDKTVVCWTYCNFIFALLYHLKC